MLKSLTGCAMLLCVLMHATRPKNYEPEIDTGHLVVPSMNFVRGLPWTPHTPGATIALVTKGLL